MSIIEMISVAMREERWDENCGCLAGYCLAAILVDINFEIRSRTELDLGNFSPSNVISLSSSASPRSEREIGKSNDRDTVSKRKILIS